MTQIASTFPDMLQTQRADQNKVLLRGLTSGFILAALVLNYSAIFRLSGAILLCLVLGITLVRGRITGNPWINLLALFGFLLITMNVIVKFHTIDAGGNAAAGIEFITPVLALWFIASNFLLKEQSMDELTTAVDTGVKLFLLVCFVDLGLRFISAGPGCFSLTSGCRTAAKFGGLAFNSNITAVPIVTCLFFARRLPVMLLFVVLLYATMNRSGLLALMAALSLLMLFDKDLPVLKKLSFGVRVAMASPFAALALIEIWPLIWFYIMSDGSFLSKLTFIDRSLHHIQAAPWRILIFGDQLNYLHIVQTYSHNGWSLHLAVLKALWYYGIIGLTFYFLLNIVLAMLSFRAFCCILTYLLMGIGGFAIFNSTMLVIPLFSAVFLYQRALERQNRAVPVTA